ncbi:type IV secretion system DNA-binding domain-containing protein, partial [Vibrio parahaemolyticus]
RSPAEELAEFLQDTDARALFADGAERMTASIRGTMATYARALRFLNPTAKTTESFSFRDWHREVETLNARKKPWVFLTSK